jgi:hypothetical protein
LVRQPVVQEKVRCFLEGRTLGELLDPESPVDQDPIRSVDVADPGVRDLHAAQTDVLGVDRFRHDDPQKPFSPQRTQRSQS